MHAGNDRPIAASRPHLLKSAFACQVLFNNPAGEDKANKDSSGRFHLRRSFCNFRFTVSFSKQRPERIICMVKQDTARSAGYLKRFAKRLLASVRPKKLQPVVLAPRVASKAATPVTRLTPAETTTVPITDLVATLKRGTHRHDAAARLVALAPVGTVALATEVFVALKQADLLSLFPVYFNRLPERTREQVQLRMYRAVCDYLTGRPETACPEIYKAVLATNGYTASGAAMAIFTEHLKAGSLLQATIARITDGEEDPDMLVFAFLVAAHQKQLKALEILLDTAIQRSETRQNPVLLFHAARAARALGRFEQAGDLIFKAHLLEPNEGMISVAAVDIGRVCPSDIWVNEAISLGERIRFELKNQQIVRQVAIALARLYVRSDDSENALRRLAELAHLNDDHPAPFSAIARSQLMLGASQAAYETLERFIQNNKRHNGILYDMAGILAAQDKVPQALALIQDNFPEASQTIATHAIIGHLYAWSGQTEQAIPWLKKVLHKAPDHGSALADMSLCVEFTREYTLALTLAEKASTGFVLDGMTPAIGMEFMHQARLRRRMMFLADMAGDERLARALQREAIAKAPIKLPYHALEWSGHTLGRTQELSGKSVVVVAELGVGDEIRYTSVMHRITAEAAQVTLSCDPRLETLLKRSFPEMSVVPVLREFPGILKKRMDNRQLAVNEPMRKIMSDALVEQGRMADLWMRGRHFFEAQCLDRSRLFQSPEEAVLTPEPACKSQFSRRIKSRAKGRKVVGLSWRGGRRTYNREPHYFELTHWLPLLKDPTLCFVNLQYAMHEDELELLRDTLGERFIEFPDLDLFDDMEGVAALCSNLDMVVAICTAVLELACAVGTKCLYLMRSPQVTHAIRLSGQPDIHGAYQDAVWASCRIIPRVDMKDADVVARGRDYITTFFASPS